MSRPKTGTVVTYSGAASAGIILAPDGVRYIFERRNFEPGNDPPSSGDVVVFEPSRDGYAIRVRCVPRKSG